MDSDEEFYGGKSVHPRGQSASVGNSSHPQNGFHGTTSEQSESESEEVSESSTNKQSPTEKSKATRPRSPANGEALESDTESEEESKTPSTGNHDRDGNDDTESSESNSSSSDKDEDDDHDEAKENEKKTLEDPFSDLCDSAEEDDKEHNDGSELHSVTSDNVNLPSVKDHEFVTMKGRGGVRIKVDLTPPEKLLEECHILRKHHYHHKKAVECIKESVRCLALTRIVYGDAMWWKMAEAETNLAKAYWELLEYPKQTQQHAEEARRLMTHGQIEEDRTYVTQSGGASVDPPSKELLLDISLSMYYLLGKALLAMRCFSDAEQHFIKAEHTLNDRKLLSTMKSADFWTTELYTARARVNIGRKNPALALEYLVKVRRLVVKKYGKTSLRLIPLLREMAQLSESDKIKYALRAYNILKANSDDNEQIASGAQYLAECYATSCADTEDDAEVYAESYFNEAVECFKMKLGANHRRTLRAQEALAKYLAAQGRNSDALVILNLIRPIYADAFGHYSSRHANLLKMTAKLCLQNRELPTAVSHLKTAVEIERKLYGSRNARTETTKKALTVLLNSPNLKHLKDATNFGDTEGDSQTDGRPRFQTVVNMAALRRRLSLI